MSINAGIEIPENYRDLSSKDLAALVEKLVSERTELKQSLKTVEPYLGDDALQYILTGKYPDILKVTMLFLDIEGYTAFSSEVDQGKGQAETIVEHLVNPIAQIAIDIFRKKYRGSINKFVGDAVLATFGFPGYTPNQEEAAVKAALEFQERFKTYCQQKDLKLNARIGIKTGYVIAGSIGGDERKQIDVLGNHVNLSQRIEDHVKNVNTETRILIDEETYLATKDNVRFRFPGHQPFIPKGKTEEVSIYEPLSVNPDRQRQVLDERVELYERDAEKAILARLKSEVSDGNARIVAILGESSTGKTQLIKQELLADTNFHSLSGYCNPLEQSASFSWVAKIAKQILGIVQDQVTDRLAELGLDVKTAMPIYSALINKEYAGYQVTGSAEIIKEDITNLFHDLVIRESRYSILNGKQGLILHADDEQNMDIASQQALEALVKKLQDVGQNHRILLSLTNHSIYDRRYAGSATTNIKLNYLKPDSIELLVGNILGKVFYSKLSKGNRRRIFSITNGDPIYTKEIAKVLKEAYDKKSEISQLNRQLINSITDTLLKDFEFVGKTKLPEKIADRIVVRSKCIGEWAFYALQLMSIAGKFSYKSDIRQLINFEPDYELLIREGFLSPINQNLEFAHDKIMHAFYESIPRERRKELHKKFAEIIEQANKDRLEQVAPKIAYHYSRSNQPEKAIVFYEMVAFRSLGMAGYSDAIKAFDDGSVILEQANPTETIFDLWNKMITLLFKASDVCLFSTSDPKGVLARTEHALDISGKIITFGKEMRLRALNGRGLMYTGQKEFDYAQKALEEAEQLATETDNWRLANVLNNLGVLYDRIEENERLAEDEINPVCLFDAPREPKNSAEYLAKSEGYFRKAIHVGTRHNLEHIFGQTYINLAIVLMKQHMIEDALIYLGLAETINAKLGRIDDLIRVANVKGSVYQFGALLNGFTGINQESSLALVKQALESHLDAYGQANHRKNYGLIAYAAANVAYDYALLGDYSNAKEYLRISTLYVPKVKDKEVLFHIDSIFKPLVR